jgi:predicted dehydrogenase
MNTPQTPSHADFSRRDFLKTSTAAAGTLAFPAILHAQHKAEKIRIGLVGCGGRGSGAANNALEADPGVQLVAMGDLFPERLESSLRGLTSKYASTPDRVDVPKERQFTGLDAYKHVLAQDIDCVLLAAPPGFRPLHFTAAVEANKHVFCEKPMGTDPVGARAILDMARRAKEKKLSVVAGFCWRYSNRRELFGRIHAGAIGEVRSLYHTYLTGPVKPMPAPETRPAGMSDVEWQLRNWMNFVWLAGDGLVEQACHSVDKMLWAMKDVAPLRCTANGGRQVPNPGGNIFDHITVHYEWANGVRGVMAQRQIGGCFNDNSDYITGEHGIATTKGGLIITGKEPWKFEGPNIDMYVQEHRELYKSIRDGAAHNDGEWMVQSTLAALMGRMAAYTGKEVTWEHMLKSEDKIFPDNLSLDMELPVAPMASPGRTKLL